MCKMALQRSKAATWLPLFIEYGEILDAGRRDEQGNP